MNSVKLSVVLCVLVCLCSWSNQKLSKKEQKAFRQMMSSFDKKYHTHHHKYSNDLSLTLGGMAEPKVPYGLTLDDDGNIQEKEVEKPVKRKIRKLRLKQHKNKNLNKKFDKYDDMVFSKNFNIKFESMSLSDEDGNLHNELSKKLKAQFDNDNFDDDCDFSQLGGKSSVNEVKEHLTDDHEALNRIEEGKQREQKMLENVIEETTNDNIPKLDTITEPAKEEEPSQGNRITAEVVDDKPDTK